MAERLGGLSLRADIANYSRAVKTGTWHLAREQEPKDYDISKGSYRNLSKSTYSRLATVTDGSFPTTTYDDMTNGALNAKRDYATRPPPSQFLSLKNVSNENQELERSLESLGIDAKVDINTGALPQRSSTREKMYTETTHTADYKWRLPFFETQSAQKTSAEFCLPSELTSAWKRCHSQFTDWDNHRRPGRNTWKDESGIFANSHLRAQLSQYQPTNTLPSWSS